MEKKIEFNINDERAGKIAEVISNKTCKKILNLIAENDKGLSVGDISSRLKIPMNTTDYNVKKLIESGLIEKTSSFFWSVKGKKIPMYCIANKKIIISPKTSFKGIIASIIAGGAIFGGVGTFINYNSKELSNSIVPQASGGLDLVYSASAKVLENANYVAAPSLWTNIWLWILVGLLLGFGFYFITRVVRRYMKKA